MRAWDSFNEVMRAQQAELAGDAVGAAPLVGRVVYVAVQMSMQIAIGKPVDTEFATHYGAQQGCIVWANRPQGSGGVAVVRDPLADRIEQAVRRGRVAHHAERIEIALRCGVAELRAVADRQCRAAAAASRAGHHSGGDDTP